MDSSTNLLPETKSVENFIKKNSQSSKNKKNNKKTLKLKKAFKNKSTLKNIEINSKEKEGKNSLKSNKANSKEIEQESILEKYLELVKENDEKIQFSYEVMMQNAVITLNSAERDSIKLLESANSLKEELFKNQKNMFSSKISTDHKSSLNSFKGDLNLSLKRKTHSVNNEFTAEEIGSASNVHNIVQVGLENKILSRKFSYQKSDLKNCPIKLTKAESYLKNKIDKEIIKRSPKQNYDNFVSNKVRHLTIASELGSHNLIDNSLIPEKWKRSFAISAKDRYK